MRMNHQCERNSDHDAVDTEGNKGACPDKCWQEFDAEQSVSSDISMRQWRYVTSNGPPNHGHTRRVSLPRAIQHSF